MSGPYVLNLRDVDRRAGSTRDFAMVVDVPEAFGNAVIGVPEGSELAIEGRLESLHDGILVTADIVGELAGECVRCLTPITRSLRVDFQELFAYSGASDFDYQIQGDELDLEQVVRDTVVPSLPFQPVCQEDCEGLCPQCGVRLLDHPGHHHEVPVDPRWAALSGLVETEPEKSDEQLPE